jgi:hypothetical protein
VIIADFDAAFPALFELDNMIAIKTHIRMVRDLSCVGNRISYSGKVPSCDSSNLTSSVSIVTGGKEITAWMLQNGCANVTTHAEATDRPGEACQISRYAAIAAVTPVIQIYEGQFRNSSEILQFFVRPPAGMLG